MISKCYKCGADAREGCARCKFPVCNHCSVIVSGLIETITGVYETVDLHVCRECNESIWHQPRRTITVTL